MKKSELALVLAWVSSVDGRHVNEMTVEAWHELVGGFDAAEFAGAVRDHYREHARNIYPANVITRLGVDRELGQLPNATDELLADQKAEWCKQHGITVAEFDAHEDDHEWIRAVSRG
jgi:hypothetical protein